MKKVYQTRFGESKGNCFQAAIASILDLQLEQVPDFCNLYPQKDDTWYRKYIEWLKERGLSSISISEDDLGKPIYKGCFLLVSGKNNDGVSHTVIYRDGICVHNSNKNCRGITPEEIDLIFPCDPSHVKQNSQHC